MTYNFLSHSSTSLPYQRQGGGLSLQIEGFELDDDKGDVIHLKKNNAHANKTDSRNNKNWDTLNIHMILLHEIMCVRIGIP